MEIKRFEGCSHVRYPNQTNAQPVYIELDIEREQLSCHISGEIGNPVPFAVWYGRVLRFAIPALTSGAIGGLLMDIAPYAKVIIADCEFRFDPQSNERCHLGEKAEAAVEQIDRLCMQDWQEEDSVIVWQAEEYFQHAPPDVDADTTDAEMIALEIELDSESDVVIEGLGQYLWNLRDKAREDQES